MNTTSIVFLTLIVLILSLVFVHLVGGVASLVWSFVRWGFKHILIFMLLLSITSVTLGIGTYLLFRKEITEFPQHDSPTADPFAPNPPDFEEPVANFRSPTLSPRSRIALPSLRDNR